MELSPPLASTVEPISAASAPYQQLSLLTTIVPVVKFGRTVTVQLPLDCVKVVLQVASFAKRVKVVVAVSVPGS